MERYVMLLLSLFLSVSSFAAQPSPSPSIALNGMGSTPAVGSSLLPSMLIGSGVNGIFSLYGGDGATLTAGNFYPLYKNGVAYQVTTGKTAYCFNITDSVGTAAIAFQLLSATASFTFNQSTALTGGVYQCGAAAKDCAQGGAAISTIYGQPGTYQFAAQTYAGFQAGNSQVYQIHMDCFEN